MKCFITAILLIFILDHSMAQRDYASYAIVGSSLTYMWFTDYDNQENNYDEYTWNINMGIKLNKRIVSGLQILNIYSSKKHTKKDYYAIYGFFTQYNLFKRQTHRLFIESSIKRGNYCITKTEYLPSKKDNLYYFGFGGGYDLPIKWVPNLYLDLAFMKYFILNKVPAKDSYSQYIIGLNYRINQH
jgi:hypothetical protein